MSPVESRYAEIGYEMYTSGDWVQPRLNHVRYYEKPPLLYWSLGSAALRLPGAIVLAQGPMFTLLTNHPLEREQEARLHRDKMKSRAFLKGSMPF